MHWLEMGPVTLRRLLVGGALVGSVLGVSVIPATAQVVSSDMTTIAVSGSGVATAPAETARIQIMVGANTVYGMMPPMGQAEPAMVNLAAMPAGAAAMGTPGAMTGDMEVTMPDPMMGAVLTAEDLTPIVDAIVAEGVAADAVTVLTGPAVAGWYGPGSSSSGLVEATVDDPTLEHVTAIIDAAAAAAGTTVVLQQVGVEYDLADCAELVDAARAAAFSDARTRAEALGRHFGASIEAPVQVSDFSATVLPIADSTGCPPPPEVAYMAGSAQAFNTPPFNPNAPAEARVVTQLSITYEFELARQ